MTVSFAGVINSLLDSKGLYAFDVVTLVVLPLVVLVDIFRGVQYAGLCRVIKGL